MARPDYVDAGIALVMVALLLPVVIELPVVIIKEGIDQYRTKELLESWGAQEREANAKLCASYEIWKANQHYTGPHPMPQICKATTNQEQKL